METPVNLPEAVLKLLRLQHLKTASLPRYFKTKKADVRSAFLHTQDLAEA